MEAMAILSEKNQATKFMTMPMSRNGMMNCWPIAAPTATRRPVRPPRSRTVLTLFPNADISFLSLLGVWSRPLRGTVPVPSTKHAGRRVWGECPGVKRGSGAGNVVGTGHKAGDLSVDVSKNRHSGSARGCSAPHKGHIPTTKSLENSNFLVGWAASVKVGYLDIVPGGRSVSRRVTEDEEMTTGVVVGPSSETCSWRVGATVWQKFKMRAGERDAGGHGSFRRPRLSRGG